MTAPTPTGDKSTAIAAHCGISAGAVRTGWRKGAPRTKEAFAEWYREHGRPRLSDEHKTLKKQETAEKVRNLKLRNADLEEQSAVRRRELVPKAEVVEAAAAAVARLRGILRGRIAEAIARLAGSPADVLQAEVDKAFDAGEAELYKLAD